MWLVLFGTISTFFVFISIIIGCGKKQIAQVSLANRNFANSSRSSSLCSSSSFESGSGGVKKSFGESYLIRRPVKRTRIIEPTAQQLRVQAAIEADRIAAIAARDVDIHPREITFKSIGGMKSFIVYNKGNDICVFKIKCTDNDIYNIDPIFSYVEPLSTCLLRVMRFNATDKIDYLTLVMGKVVDFTGNEENDWNNTIEREDVIITLRVSC
ncbi:unnamed protein product [Auanema sp. JU1783]|nr:unnamed protein product [Auanema sp. JU1783]